MASASRDRFASVLEKQQSKVLEAWLLTLSNTTTPRGDLVKAVDVREDARRFLAQLARAVGSGLDTTADGYAEVRGTLEDLSVARARAGSTPAETAIFVFSLKAPLFEALKPLQGGDAEVIAADFRALTDLIDNLGLYTIEAFQRSREEIISRQQQELLELSTPVVQLWRGVLALPLIGTLDSARTQIVMESLLQEIVRTGAFIAIIDITGVPTVDTLVAQHLLKTVAAARLMGADCIISGIRPQIAQTIVHLGVDLQDVITKASIADAFAIALQRLGLVITQGRKPAEA